MKKITKLFIGFILVIGIIFSSITLSGCNTNSKFTCDITYDLDGGINDFFNPSQIEGKTTTEINNPEKLGYDFIGWSVNGEEPIKDLKLNTTKKIDYNLKAIWKASTYKVTLDYGNSAYMNQTVDMTYDADYNLPIPTLESDIFDGWYYYFSKLENSGKWGIASDCTITASWTSKESTITLNPNGGTLDKTTLNVEYGKSYTLPTPEYEAHTFTGWYLDNTLIESEGIWNYLGNKTLVAKWDLIQYDISLFNGEELHSIIKLHYGDTYTLPTLTKDGYSFRGWYLGDKLVESEGIWQYIGDKSLVASFENNVYNVRLNLNYNDEFETISVTYDKPYTLPVLIRDNYEFRGWYYNDTLIEDGDSWNILPTESGPITLEAHWSNEFVTITYIIRNLVNDNTTLTTKVEKGTYFIYPEYDSPSDRTLTQWYDSNEVPISKITKVNSNLTVYADEYTIGLTFTYDQANRYYVVSRYTKSYEEVFIPKYYLGEIVGKLGNSLFLNNSSVKKVYFSDGVVEIGNYVFQNTNVTTVTDTTNVTKIGSYAFANSKIESLHVTSHDYIGEHAFDGCSEFTGFTYVYGSDISYNNTIKRIEPYTFFGCKKMKDFPFADQLTSIGSYSFSFSGLETIGISFGSNLKEIGDYAFAGTKLTSISTGECEFFGDSVFMDASNLSSVVFNNVVRYVGYKIFEGTNMSFYEEDNNKYVKTGINNYAILYEGNSSTYASTTLVIAGGAFEGNKTITSITINKNTYGIGALAFYGCTNLETINIPASSFLMYIGSLAFVGTKITSLNLPASICCVLGRIIPSTVVELTVGTSNTTYIVLDNNDYLNSAEFPMYPTYEYTEYEISNISVLINKLNTATTPIIFSDWVY